MSAIPKAGDVISIARAFSVEEVRAFAALSGDHGSHHEVPDAEGRLMVHGLLTCSILTSIGGSLNYIAREMHFEFVRPVFTGDIITAEFKVDAVDEQAGAWLLAGTAVCRNQHGKEVLKAITNGVIRRPREP